MITTILLDMFFADGEDYRWITLTEDTAKKYAIVHLNLRPGDKLCLQESKTTTPQEINPDTILGVWRRSACGAAYYVATDEKPLCAGGEEN